MDIEIDCGGPRPAKAIRKFMSQAVKRNMGPEAGRLVANKLINALKGNTDVATITDEDVEDLLDVLEDYAIDLQDYGRDGDIPDAVDELIQGLHEVV